MKYIAFLFPVLLLYYTQYVRLLGNYLQNAQEREKETDHKESDRERRSDRERKKKKKIMNILLVVGTGDGEHADDDLGMVDWQVDWRVDRW